MQQREINKRKVRGMVDKLKRANDKATEWHERREITQTLVEKKLGVGSFAVRQHMEAIKDELAEHHALYDIKPRHNSRVHSYKRWQEPSVTPVAITPPDHHLDTINRFAKRAFGLLGCYKTERYSFMGGTITNIKLTKNAYVEEIEVLVDGLRLDLKPAKLSKIRRIKKAPASDARLFTQLVSVTLEWKGVVVNQ